MHVIIYGESYLGHMVYMMVV